MPVVECDLAVHRAAGDARRSGVLLAAAQAIRERVVGGDVIHGGSRLRVPVAPRCAAVRRNDAALIGNDEQNLRIVRIDPDLLIVVAARRAAHGRPVHAAVLASPHHGRRGIHNVLVLRIHRDGRQVAATDPRERPRIDFRLRRTGGRDGYAAPVLAAVGRLEEADDAGHRIGAAAAGGRHVASRCRIQHARVARGNGDVRLNDARQPVGQLSPGRAAVSRLVHAVAGAAEPLTLDEALLLLPQGRIDDVRIGGIDADVVAARVFVFGENLLERAAAIGRSENPSLRIRPVGMSERGDEKPIGVARVDVDHRDHLRVAKAEVRPRLAGVGRLVNG